MALFTKIQLGTITILIVALSLGYARYSSVKASYELEKQAADQAIEAMDSLKEAYERAEEQRTLAFAILAQTEDELASMRLENRDLEERILSADDDQDGAVAPILEDLRSRRFGGQR